VVGLSRTFRIVAKTDDLMSDLKILPDDASWTNIWEWAMKFDLCYVEDSEKKRLIADNKISGCEMSEVHNSICNMQENAYISALEKHAKEVLEEWLLNASNFNYSYYSEEDDDEGEQIVVEGRAKGIKNVFIGWEDTHIIVYDDFLHIVNQIKEYNRDWMSPIPKDRKELKSQIKHDLSVLRNLHHVIDEREPKINFDKVQSDSWWNFEDKTTLEIAEDFGCKVGDEEFKDWWIEQGEMDDEGDWL